MERPNIPPWSLERKLLSYSNHVFTIVFAIEMVLKAIANCYVFGETAYFKDNWNRMDGTLVIISLVGKNPMLPSTHSKPYLLHSPDATITAIVGKKSKIFGMLRVFRLVRALRPLRVINR